MNGSSTGGTARKDPFDSRAFSNRLREELLATVPTALVSGATIAAFIQVFGSWVFLWPSIWVAVSAHLAGALTRALRGRSDRLLLAPLTLLIPLVSAYFSVARQRFPETLTWGAPTSRTWSAVSRDLSEAWNLIGDVVTPVDYASGFGTLAMVVIGFVAIVTDSFAHRYGGRVEVFVPSAATLFIVAAVGTDAGRVAISAGWITTAVIATAMIRINHVRRDDRAASRVPKPYTSAARTMTGLLLFAGTVGIGAAITGPLLPGAGNEALLTQNARGAARELQPLVDIRRQLTDPSPAVLFTVRSTASAYWRMSALASFDGSTWSISERQLNSAAGSLRQPDGAEDIGIESISNLQTFTIGGLAGSLVPVAATPTQLRASTQSLFYEPESGSLLVGGDGLRTEDSYVIQSTMLSPDAARLDRATSATPPDEKFLDLPDIESIGELRSIATSIVPTGASPYRQALALQDFFRTQFAYSLDSPALDGPDATLEFLERRSGYCEHFASTFALFSRTLGIPARVAVGFTPGDPSILDSGATLYTVQSKHAHAWPEVWFDGIGWVLFEPTPGRGAPNASHTNVPEQQVPETPETETEAATTTTAAPSLDESAPSTSTAPSAPIEPSAGSADDGIELLPLAVALLVAAFAIAWIALLPRACRNIIAKRDEDPILVLWRRAVALYELERGRIPDSLSAREVAAQATSRLYDDDSFIFELAEHASRVLFDPAAEDLDNSSESHRSKIVKRGELYLAARLGRLSPLLRVRALIDPVSVWRLQGGPRRGWRRVGTGSGEASTR